MTVDLDQIRERADAATPGPWVTENDGIYNASRSYMVTPTGDDHDDRADAEFIAHARTDIPMLLDLLQAVLDLHVDSGYGWCKGCLDEDHERFVARTPCPTRRLILQEGDA